MSSTDKPSTSTGITETVSGKSNFSYIDNVLNKEEDDFVSWIENYEQKRKERIRQTFRPFEWWKHQSVSMQVVAPNNHWCCCPQSLEFENCSPPDQPKRRRTESPTPLYDLSSPDVVPESDSSDEEYRPPPGQVPLVQRTIPNPFTIARSRGRDGRFIYNFRR